MARANDFAPQSCENSGTQPQNHRVAGVGSPRPVLAVSRHLFSKTVRLKSEIKALGNVGQQWYSLAVLPADHAGKWAETSPSWPQNAAELWTLEAPVSVSVPIRTHTASSSRRLEWAPGHHTAPVAASFTKCTTHGA